MTLAEIQALVTYLDDQLMSLCREMTPHMDPDVIGTLYDKAYHLIHDVENTLTAQLEISRTSRLPLINNKR